MPTSLAADPIALAAREGLSAPAGLSAPQKTLPPWLFYDDLGCDLFVQITQLPEYYLTRTERALLALHAAEILAPCTPATPVVPVTIVELGAGNATKTGLLLSAAAKLQPGGVLYQPIDIAPSALAAARADIEAHIPGVTVRPQTANYITESYRITRQPGHSVLALYIGSSIGNFAPAEARAILTSLRAQLRPGDHLLLGTDLAPSPTKSVAQLLAAYDDAAGTTAAFNRNILTRLNRELGTSFNPTSYAHKSIWNATESRIEMHLVAPSAHTVTLPANSSGPALTLHFAAGESIHTENSYKFTPATLAALLHSANFTPTRTFQDPDHLYALTLASAS